MSFLRSPQYKQRVTIETPVPPKWLDAFRLQDALVEINYELSGERRDPFEGVPFNDRRMLAILMTEYAVYKQPRCHKKYKRSDNAAVQYFMNTERKT